MTTIVGFTELAADNRLYGISAAVFQRGSVVGVYRKRHPAINRSVYAAGRETPVFRAGALTFGIVICYDSNFTEPARLMAAPRWDRSVRADQQQSSSDKGWGGARR